MSRDREALIDIVEAIKLILRYVEGVDFASLTSNSKFKKSGRVRGGGECRVREHKVN